MTTYADSTLGLSAEAIAILAILADEEACPDKDGEQQAVAAMNDGPGDEGDLPPDYKDTQLALACELLGRIGIPSPDLLRRLDELLDRAQNPPPEGKADGSIHERKFNRLRAMVRAGETFLAAYNTALED
jgi:hypothetical protein